MADGEMDLYADDLGGELGSEEDGVDLYEDVIAGASNLGAQQTTQIHVSAPGRKFQLYVGNLTWWTTDQDIAHAIISLGVLDFVEVKFFEHRPNGQSKGYCVITLGSEKSVKTCMEALPKLVLHGKNPVVTYPTKQALLHFESTCKIRPDPTEHTQQQMGMNPRAAVAPPGVIRSRMPVQNNNSHMSLPPLQQPPPYWNQARPMTRPSVPPVDHQRTLARDWNRPPPRPNWNRPPSTWNMSPGGFPPQGMPMHQPPPGGPRVPPPPNIPPQNPNPHVNPAFFNQGPPPPQPNPVHPSQSGYGPPPQARLHNYPPPPQQEHKPEVPTLSEAEFEEIMARNRTLSSSAIARAVSDAAAGEYASSIETLVTAISLIKQSKTAKDERCKILVSSLQDTLLGVETKSYSSSRRERSRSRDRDRNHHRRSRRDRSRSRDREYRDRSRDREKDRYYGEYGGGGGRDRSRSRDRERSREDKYYEDRYRERDRDRERSGAENSRREPERDRERDHEKEEIPHRSSRH